MNAATGALDSLVQQPPDPLLKLIAQYRADTRPYKIDVGLGVYRDAFGRTPVLSTVKAAERRLVEEQTSKSYLGAVGDAVYCDLLHELVFAGSVARERTAAVQTPGGTGALRLATDLFRAARPNGCLHVGLPTWPVHHAIFRATATPVATFTHADLGAQRLDLEAALSGAAPHDAVLLHAACHNPTGIDFAAADWRRLGELCAAHGVLPLVDFAYHGLGGGLEEDALGLRELLRHVDQAIVTYSCDKNFGLYRDRVGALFVVCRDAAQAQIVQGNIERLARSLWSMPPDHGGAVVRTILSDTDLRRDWTSELTGMRQRIVEIRRSLAAVDRRLAPLASQFGIFSSLNLGDEAVARLAAQDAIYMAAPGRINVAGLAQDQVERFGKAVLAYL